MAPLDYVPHAVHIFLEQVAHGLWNGCYFYINGPHVLQAGPQSFEDDDVDTNDNLTKLAIAISTNATITSTKMEDSSSSSTTTTTLSDNDETEWRGIAIKPFKEKGLDVLAFPEYSPSYPHVTWTLGYTGRPGGPDFYINKVDNTQAHGPGGQYQHVLEEQGDPCFAKVVKGQENVTLLFQQPTYEDRSEWHYFFQEPVEIVKAILIPDLTEKAATEKTATAETATAQTTTTTTTSMMDTTTAAVDATNPLVALEPSANSPNTSAASNSTSETNMTTDTNVTNASTTTEEKSPESEKDPIALINEKLKRKPKYHKLKNQVDP